MASDRAVLQPALLLATPWPRSVVVLGPLQVVLLLPEPLSGRALAASFGGASGAQVPMLWVLL